MSKDSMTFEKSIQRLDEIVKALEKGDAPLDASLKLFEEGASLVTTCGKLLDEAEQQVVKLMKTEDGTPAELPFEQE